VRDWSENNLLFSIYHMSPSTLTDYVQRLASYAPEEIHAYPSALVTLVRFACGRGLTLPRPRAVIVSAETLTAATRELLERALECRVHNQYGNAEMTIFAAECPEGSLHLDIGYGHLELVNGVRGVDGTETGEAITTGFGNRAMPLIRYRVGDTVSLSEESCSCGSPQPVIHEVVGRTDDLLILPDGRVVGRLDPVFKGLVGLEEVQIVQERRDQVVLKVVPGPGYSERVERAMVRALADRLGQSVDIRARVVRQISRTERGKFRAVIRRPGV
jgi:phenylacetate-CoA ligase